MNNTPKVLKKRSRHLQKLINTGENLETELHKLEIQQGVKNEILSKYHEWFQRVVTELSSLLPAIGQSSILEEIKLLKETSESVAVIRGKLRGIYLDIEQGQLNQLVYSVQKKGVEDLLVQADDLMSEDGNYHLASICAAITLEYAVKKLCEREQIIPENGKWSPLGSLLSTLKENSIINEHTYNRLDSWRKIRNDSVHGKFENNTESNGRDKMTVVNFL